MRTDHAAPPTAIAAEARDQGQGASPAAGMFPRLSQPMLQRKLANRLVRRRAASAAPQDVARSSLDTYGKECLDKLADVRQAAARGDALGAYARLDRCWMRDMVFILRQLQQQQLLDVIANNLERGKDKYDIDRIRPALEVVRSGTVDPAVAGVVGDEPKGELDAFAELRRWPATLPEAALKGSAPPPTANVTRDPKRQALMDYIKLGRAALLEHLASKHPGTPPRTDLKLDPKGALHESLRTLHEQDPGVATRLLDAGITFQGAQLLVVDTDLQAVEKEAGAAKAVNGNATLCALLVEVANTKAGWGQAARSSPGVHDVLKGPGWNAQEWAVDHRGQRHNPSDPFELRGAGARYARRIPLDRVRAANQSPATDGATRESAADRCIVIIPSQLDATRPVDILLHLHGMNIGYRQRDAKAADAETVRDVHRDEIEQQILAAERNIIAILPQGSGAPSFGEFSTDVLITEVLGRLHSLEPPALPAAVQRGRTLLSGHSGGGSRIGAMAAPGSKQALDGVDEVVLFDAEGSAGWGAWVSAQLERDKQALRAAQTPEAQRAYLRTSKRFRGYYGIGGHYQPAYQAVKMRRDQFFKAARKDLLHLPADVWVLFESNYRIEGVPYQGGVEGHNNMVGGGNLSAALRTG